MTSEVGVRRSGTARQPAKKPYVTPRLTRYGRFTEIVQGVNGTKAEPGGPRAGRRSRA
jgi:hypothetical protein